MTFFTPCSTEMEVVFKNEGVTISKSASYEVLEFNPKHFEFSVSEGRPTNTDFYINANYFFKGGEPMGLVVVDGKKKHNKRKGGGFFYVKNGKPSVSSRYCPSSTQHSAQSVFWAINDGKINNFGVNENHSKIKVLRTLIGQNEKGQIILIVSKIRLDAKTIIEFGETYNLVDAIFCDGGTSVDYYFKTDGYFSTFKAWSDGVKSIIGIDQPPVYIGGNFK